MAKYEWSEIFLSIEGEGPYSGQPTAYIRFSRCNFACAGFSNPTNKQDKDGYAPLTFVPSDYKTLQEIPMITMGCDSQYAVNPTFSHMWRKGDTDELVAALMEVVPHHQWNHPVTGLPTVLSLTGGEPTLRAKFIPELLNHPLLADLRTVLIETNCSVPLKLAFIVELNKWLYNGPRDEHGHPLRTIVWSNSPKLSASGEKWEDAIVPTVALSQHSLWSEGREQYFKFVCDASDNAFDEVARAMALYHAAGIPKDVPVYIMPESCTQQQQDDISAAVADKCLQRGYIYCHRIHNSVYANAIGK